MNDYTLDEARTIIATQRAKLFFLRKSIEALGELAVESSVENPISAGRRLERICLHAQNYLVEVRDIQAPTTGDDNGVIPPGWEEA